MLTRMKNAWARFVERRPGFAQFLLFTVFSQAVTVLQLALMPLFRAWFNTTSLLETSFQVFPIGSDVDGSQYFMFDYPAGALPEGGGGLAYFLAVQITLAIAQIINFFLQRNITFKSNSSPWIAAMWYFIAYVAITFIAAAAQGFYKAPVYDFFIDTLEWGSTGETVADVLTMIIYAMISFWVFFPIFKIIFKRTPEDEGDGTAAAGDAAPATAGTVSTGAHADGIGSDKGAPGQ